MNNTELVASEISYPLPFGGGRTSFYTFHTFKASINGPRQSWWAEAPREGFTAYVQAQELPRMAQSKEASQLSSTYTLGAITEKRTKGGR